MKIMLRAQGLVALMIRQNNRHQQDLNLRPQRGTDASFESVAVTTWL